MQIRESADLTRFASVRAALARPEEAPPTLEELTERAAANPTLAHFLAVEGAEAVGVAVAGVFPGDDPEHVFADAAVLPAHRRRGAGTALLRAASAHARALGGSDLTGEVREDDPESLAFALRRGFVELERQKAVALDLAAHELEQPAVPAGFEIVERREEHVRGMYEVAVEAQADIPGLDAGHAPSFDEWRAWEVDRSTRDPRLAFVALAGGRVAGFASVDASGHTGYHGLTAVGRAHRRRGLARALKLHQIAAARRLGLAYLVTESEERNAPMRLLNESLGYRPIPGSIVLRGPLLD